MILWRCLGVEGGIYFYVCLGWHSHAQRDTHTHSGVRILLHTNASIWMYVCPNVWTCIAPRLSLSLSLSLCVSSRAHVCRTILVFILFSCQISFIRHSFLEKNIVCEKFRNAFDRSIEFWSFFFDVLELSRCRRGFLQSNAIHLQQVTAHRSTMKTKLVPDITIYFISTPK